MKFTEVALVLFLAIEATQADGPYFRNARGARSSEKKARTLKARSSEKKARTLKKGKDADEEMGKVTKGEQDKMSEGQKKRAKGQKKSSCNKDGSSDYPYQGLDNSQRLLLREGIIDSIPGQMCPKDREVDGKVPGKNVILVVGDGMVSFQETRLDYSVLF
jgi:hypothetical protein